MRKKIICGVLALFMTAGLTACDEAMLEEMLSYESEISSTESYTASSDEDTSSETFVDTSNEDREGPYDVIKVVDGDTLKISIDGERKNVRLIGIDTPESVHPDEEKNVPEGKSASDHTKELVGDKQVYLEYGTEPADRYGRPLCYVYLPDGTMLNEKILSDGYAKVLIVGKNKEYKDRFYEIQDEAKAEGRGLWPTGVFDKKTESTSSKK